MVIAHSPMAVHVFHGPKNQTFEFGKPTSSLNKCLAQFLAMYNMKRYKTHKIISHNNLLTKNINTDPKKRAKNTNFFLETNNYFLLTKNRNSLFLVVDGKKTKTKYIIFFLEKKKKTIASVYEE